VAEISSMDVVDLGDEAGAVGLVDDGHAPAFADGQTPAGISVHVLPKPLEMQRVFRAVADALGVD